MAFQMTSINIKRGTFPISADISCAAVLLAFRRVCADMYSLAFASKACLSDLALVVPRICAASMRIKADIDLFAETFVTMKTVRTACIVLAGSRGCANGVGETLIPETE